MLLSVLFTFCYSSFLSQKKDSHSQDRPHAFTFSTNPRKKYTLSNPNDSVKSSNIFLQLYKRLTRSNQEVNDQKQWYYVHIFGDISKVQEHVNLRIADQIVKNTFILYLSASQIEKISPYSLVKLLDPSDKIDLLCPYNETNYFYVETAPNSALPVASDLFSIEKVNSDNSYVIRVEQDGLEKSDFEQKKKKVTKLLSKDPTVKLITTYKKPVLQNDINIGYVQKNRQSPHRDAATKQLIFSRYVHDHGLTGQGEIITIEDSPIDFRHPMFKDDNVAVEFNKDMPNHRKFLFYQSYTDMKGWEDNLKNDEHGTHTAGSLAGKTVVKEGETKAFSSLFDGAAPDARLVYAGLYGNITGEDLERAMNTHNSRISSNSWGDNDKYVDPLNHEYGLLAYNNPNSIFIFAAGNYAIFGPFGIIDPSGSKNVLCVSATSSPLLSNAQQFIIQSEDDPSIFIKCIGIFPTKEFEFTSDFLGTEPDKGASIVAVRYEKDESGSDDAVCAKLNGQHISLLYGEDMLEMNDFIDFCFYETKGLLKTTDIESVNKLLERKIKIKATLNPHNDDEVLPLQKGSFASIGPGNKGMIKPDVTAPGTTIISARSYNVSEYTYNCNDISEGCGLIIKEGTSMSTPIVAGNAALVAQYFKSGKWIDQTEIDGSTLRALLINSANHPKGSKQPDTLLGHGVVDISNILPLENEFGVQIPPQDKATTVKENGHVAAEIDVKSNKVDLQITMSYLDVMLEESSPIPLTRDLDMVVVSPDGEIFKGDHLDGGDTEHFSTNEKVIVKKEEIKVGKYTVHVFGNNFLDSGLSGREVLTQNFSVVATGDIDSKYITFAESTVSPCGESDPQNPGFCKCKENEIGPLCQAKIVDVEDTDVLNNFTFQPREITRLRFKSDRVIEGLELFIEYGSMRASAWISPKCHLSMHEYETHVNFPMYEPGTVDISFGTTEICVLVFANNPDPAEYHIELITGDKPVPTKEPSSEPSAGPSSAPSSAPSAGPSSEPSAAPSSEPQPSNDGADGGNQKKDKTSTALIAVLVVLGVLAVAGIVAIVIIVVRMKKGRNDIELLKSEGATSNEPLRSPLLF